VPGWRANKLQHGLLLKGKRAHTPTLRSVLTAPLSQSQWGLFWFVSLTSVPPSGLWVSASHIWSPHLQPYFTRPVVARNRPPRRELDIAEFSIPSPWDQYG